MVHIDEVGNRYAWKGPGWRDGRGRMDGNLTERPNHTTPVYEFDTGGRFGYNKFYTVWPPEAYNIAFNVATHWTYSKDQNGRLAPKFWVYHRDWYWFGKLSFSSSDSRPNMNSQLNIILNLKEQIYGMVMWHLLELLTEQQSVVLLGI